MSKKTVDLIIRAQDQASKVVRATSASLHDFLKSQSSVRSSASQTGNVFARLGGAFGQFSKVVKSSLLKGVEKDFSRSGTAAAKLTRKMKEAAWATQYLTQKRDKAAKAMDREIVNLHKANRAQEALGKSIGNEGKNREKLLNRQARLLERISKQEERLAGARARQKVASQKMEAGGGKTGAASLERASRSVATHNARLAELRTKNRVVQASIRATSERMREMGGSLAQTDVRVTSQTRKLSAIESSYKKWTSAAKFAGQQQKNLAQSVAQAGGVIGSQGSKSALATAKLDQYGASTARAARHTKRLGASSGALAGLQGRITSLVAAYAGVHSVLSVLKGTLKAVQSLEAARSRLNVAFDGNIKKVSVELDFIKRNANRMGVEFGGLASEYAKFAIATKGTNLQGANTRKIFIAVAEAARVNKSSMSEMRGVFTALTQIVSKGAVQMEELRQQLGDRLPGAVRLMADGLGVSTAELIKMMEQGKVTADALVPFAEELTRKFGEGLPQALKSTTTSMGRLQNQVTQAQIAFAQSGFLEGFNALLKELVELLGSTKFRAFAASISKVMGGLAKGVALAARHFDLLVMAVSAFAGMKVAGLVLKLGKGLFRLKKAAMAGVAGFAAMRAGLVALTATSGVAATALGALTVAVRTLLSATGIGLIFTGISMAVAYFSTRVSTSSSALEEYVEIVDSVKNAWEEASRTGKKWRGNLKDIPVTRVRKNLQDLRQALKDTRNRAPALSWYNPAGTKKSIREARQLRDAFRKGEISAHEFRKAIDNIAQADSSFSREYTLKLLESADAAQKMEKKIGQLELVLKVLTGTQKEAAAAMQELNGGTIGFIGSQKQAEVKAGQFNSELEKMKGFLSDVADGLKEVGDSDALEKLYQDALKAATNLGEVWLARQAYRKGLSRLMDRDYGGYTDGVEASAALIRQEEGFRNRPYWDVNAFRVGYGSDTVTLSDGTVRKVVKGMEVSRVDAERDLYRRISEEFQPQVVRQIGGETFGSLNAQQQAALTSLAWNYGSLPERIVKAFNTSRGVGDIQKAIQGLGTDNRGINQARRWREAALYGSKAGEKTHARRAEDTVREERLDAQRQEQEKAEKERKRLEDERARQAELSRLDSLREELQLKKSNSQAELSAIDNVLVKREQLKALRAAETEAQYTGIAMTRQESLVLVASVEAKFRARQTDEKIKLLKQAANEEQERANALLERAKQLHEAIKLAQEAGDTDAVVSAKEELEEVNAQLTNAVTNAKKMWAAIGGPGADTARTKLGTVRLEAQNLEKQAHQNKISWKQVGDWFANGLTSAFDRFSSAVAEGKNIGEAARVSFLQFASDFLRKIAQMILQQTIMNALKAVTAGGPLAGLFAVGHTGGLIGSKRVGSGNTGRNIAPSWFASAARYHNGGIAGLRPGEVPIIAKKGEEILTRDDPRHLFNATRSQSTPASPDIRIVNTVDAGSFMDAGLNSRHGERAILNFIAANSAAVKVALG